MLLSIALRAINHVLAGEEWAQRRLQAFSGQALRLRLGRFEWPLQIADNGFFIEPASADPSSGGAQAAVSITLPADTPARLLLDRASVIGAMQISGSAELAECLGFVFKNLRWDAEHDLAQVVGDIAARRLAEGGKRFIGWQTAQIANLTANFVEFFTAEQGSLSQRGDAENLFSAITATEDAVDLLEARITRLESSTR